MSERKSTNKWTFEHSRQARLKLWEFLAMPQSELDHPGRAHKLLKNAARLGIQLVDALESHRAELDDRDAAIRAFLSTKITFDDIMTFLKYLELLQKTGNSQPKEISREDGVAQRVLRELAEQDGQDKWTFSETARDAGKVEGAKYLYAELSAETRWVLAVKPEAQHQERTPGAQILTDKEKIAWRLGQYYFAECLGLVTNDPEDNDE